MSNNQSPSLAEQITRLVVGPGQLAVWALGQHGFVLKGGDTTLIIDPYLSNYVEDTSDDASGALARLVPVAIPPDQLDMIDVALITHHHIDHCDPDTLRPLLAASQAQVITSYTARAMLTKQGFDAARINVPPIDQPLVLDDTLTVTPIPAAHYEHEPDAHGNPAYLGFIINMNGVTVYHSGDGVIYPGLIERLQQHPIDLAMLPINGRDWFREQQGLVGNMDYREAADLAATVGIRVLIPAHNDMFRSNRVNGAYLVDYLATKHPTQRVHFLQAGELYYYAG